MFEKVHGPDLGHFHPQLIRSRLFSLMRIKITGETSPRLRSGPKKIDFGLAKRGGLSLDQTESWLDFFLL